MIFAWLLATVGWATVEGLVAGAPMPWPPLLVEVGVELPELLDPLELGEPAPVPPARVAA